MYHIHDRDRNTPGAISRHRRTFVLILVLIVFLVPTLFAPGRHALADDTTTFTPTVIPLSADEIGNPGRGLHRWNGQSFVPAPMRDSYRRRHWSEIETAPQVYDLSPYDSDLTYASQHGMRLILGLPQPTGPSTNGGSWVPDDLTSDHFGAWNRGSYHPNFNDATVMGRWKALIDAIAQRYANDPRVSGIQLCIVGAYGEWYFDASVPDWARPSDATAQAMIDYSIAKFPNKQVYMLLSSSMPQATIYALQRSPHIGWARMALGDSQFDSSFQSHYANNASFNDLVSNRWKTAPIMTETYRSADLGQFATILDQVQRYHISLVGNGNFDGTLASLANWGSKQVSDFQLAGKLAGYRYVLQSLTLSALARGHAFSATSAWTNVGVAPIYEPWHVHLQLRDASNAVVFDTASALDLRTVLPGKATTQADTWTLPAELAAGSYHVHVFIPPLTSAVGALQLAIAGRGSDGSYDLGTVVVTNNGAAPEGVPTTTATPARTTTATPAGTTIATPVATRNPTISPTTDPKQQTITFVPDADARVTAAAPDANFGTWQTLRVDKGPDPEIQSYLHFTLRNLPSSVLRATLRIYATSQSQTGAAIYATSPTWTENGLTWNNRPRATSSVAGEAVAVHSDTWVTYDITPLVKGNGPISLLLVARSIDGMNFTSRETSTPPQLLVTLAKP